MFTVTSFSFFIFLTLAIVLYYMTPARFRWIELLAASFCFFFKASSLATIPHLIYGIVVTFGGALLIQNAKSEKKRKFLLVATLLLSIGQLTYLKYLNMFVGIDEFFVRKTGIGFGWQQLKILAPIGVSYYMVTAIGYVLDVYWGTVEAEKNIFKHALFLCYFPQLTSGPFTKYTDMGKELFTVKRFDLEKIAWGGVRLLWGLFKKLVIADRLATIVGTIYGDLESYFGIYILIGVFSYAIQLYCDFSGCLDIVLGASEMFGINLPQNFDLPFLSEDVSEFWRRWHISLGVWFKEYLFYPILKSEKMQSIAKAAKKKFGRKAGKNISTYMGLICNWLVIGVWHGGSLKYMTASAFIPCLYLILSNTFQPVFERMTKVFRIKTQCFSWKLFRRIRTFLLMCVVFGIARAENMAQAGMLWSHLFKEYNPWILFDESIYQLGLNRKEVQIVVIAIVLLFLMENLKYRIGSLREALKRQNIVFRWIIVYALLFAVITFGVYGPNYNAVDFIYGGF